MNALHIATVGATVTCVLLMDLRILGAIASIEQRPFVRLMREAVAVVLPVAILTGLLMFAVRAQEYATNTAFQLKMVLLALAGLNLAIYRRMAPDLAAGAEPPAAARALAAVSIGLWLTILVAGRFIGFI